MTKKTKLLVIIASLTLGALTLQAETLSQEQIKQQEQAKLNQSDVGLVSKQHADGTVSVDLQGRFQMYSKVVIDANGNQKFICNEHPNVDFATHKHNTQVQLQKPAVTELKQVAR